MADSHSSFMVGPLKWLIAIPVAVLCLLMVMAGEGQVQPIPSEARAQPVRVLPVEQVEDYDQHHQLIGRVESQQHAQLGFELAGNLASIDVDEGDNVERGQQLARLDDAQWQAQRNEAEARLVRLEAEADLAHATLSRIKKLVTDGVESQQRLDEARRAKRAALAAITEAEARLAGIEVVLQQTRITAPFNGVITQRYRDTGSVVSAGAPVVDITATDQLEARIAVPELSSSALTLGQDYSLRVGTTAVNARLVSLNPVRRSTTQTRDARFIIKEDSALIAGDLVTLTVSHPIQQAGTWLPLTALQKGLRGLWQVYVVENGVAQVKTVQVVYTHEQQAFVTGPLGTGDRVVIEGGHRIAPEQAVSVIESSSSSSGG